MIAGLVEVLVAGDSAGGLGEGPTALSLPVTSL